LKPDPAYFSLSFYGKDNLMLASRIGKQAARRLQPTECKKKRAEIPTCDECTMQI
jgi:hypothetical protein